MLPVYAGSNLENFYKGVLEVCSENNSGLYNLSCILNACVLYTYPSGDLVAVCPPPARGPSPLSRPWLGSDAHAGECGRRGAEQTQAAERGRWVAV